MARQKLSEYRAKTIISNALNLPYAGWPIDAETLLDDQIKKAVSAGNNFVVKVDEGVKGRYKKGLVKLDVAPADLGATVESLAEQGYRWLIIEPMFGHDQTEERYLSLASSREGLLLQYSSKGGINIEKQAGSIQKVWLNKETDWEDLAAQTGISSQLIKDLVQALKDDYFAFMEINPYVVSDNGLRILDSAVEVDDAATFFVNDWKPVDFRRHNSQKPTDEEKVVEELDANSPASLKLSVLEPDGGIFLLLSGGGASVVVADEIYNQGYGEQLANYGEYSGNPNAEETYIYTKQLLSLLLKSSAPRKILFIGGAVANFTDVAKTFAGVIKAIEEVAGELKTQHVKVFVRRGGPNQETGLAEMEATLAKHDLLGAVHDPETPLTAAVTEALEEYARE
ncbi:MAG TPA: ATP citrate lyase citrate-binding domain-containing protein [Candidatus Saccharimonadales bacterium]|jgi:ATP-citrate lyase beta-subunit|nr:ATP citrate lyase citrate-binding domain-containing protein [Candidatus Saccharimonadales bacterium]